MLQLSENSKALSFPKSEKIKLKKQIETLFRNGKAFQFGQLKFIWNLQHIGANNDAAIKFGVSVPKKKLPRANKRNTTKRRIREAFRIQKNVLYPTIHSEYQLHLFVIYTDNKLPVYANIYTQINKGINKLLEEIAKYSSTTQP